MSTKKEKKVINARRRRNEYILDNSDDGELSEDIQGSKRRILYNSNLFKSSTTPRKGRDLERTRSRPSNKEKIKSPAFSENTDGDLEDDDEDFDENESEILCDHTILKGGHDFCRERLKIGKNLLKNKFKGEVYKKEFREKIQLVFKEIYSYYYDYEKHKATPNIEKEIKSLSSQINEKLLNCRPDYLHLFVKLLNENVSIYIKSFKNSITEQSKNKKLREKYYELKKSIFTDINKDLCQDSNNTSNLGNVYININNSSVKQKCINEILNFCKDNKTEIVSIINDLNKVYQILSRSAPLINQIFKIPFMELENEYDTKLTMENIHKEEFFNVIINDDFIKSLIIEVKNKELPIFIEIRPVINKIEDEISNSEKDMAKLKCLLEEFLKQEKEESCKEEDLSYLNDAKSLHQFLINTSKNNSRVGQCINVNCKNNRAFNFIKEKIGKYSSESLEPSLKLDPKNISTTACDNLLPGTNNSSNFGTPQNPNLLPPNISKVKLKHNENVHKNLDELYEYIIADDKDKNSKKNNKKNANKQVNQNTANKKKINEKCNNHSNSHSNNSFALEIDKEVEDFKNKLLSESIHASCVRKVKPKISSEWMQKIISTK